MVQGKNLGLHRLGAGTVPCAGCGNALSGCDGRPGMVQAKVSAPTRAGRALRRSLLKGCVVVIVVAGYSGKRFVYERAHELGIRCRLRCQLLRCSCHR